MNRDDVIKLAQEAGVSNANNVWLAHLDELERFAALVAAEWQAKCNTYIQLHDAVVKDSDRLYAQMRAPLWIRNEEGKLQLHAPPQRKEESEPVAQVQVAEDYHAHVIWTEGVNPVDLDQKYLYVAPPQRQPYAAQAAMVASQTQNRMSIDPVTGDVGIGTVKPQREWQGLTDENEIKHCWYEACQTDLELTSQLVVYFARAIEAKLKEKNT